MRNFDGSFTLKYHKANSQSAPIKVATVHKRGNEFNVITATGKTIPGSTVIPTSDGFIVGRTGSAFRYVIGQDHVRSITLLDNYNIAKYQNGDAASTGYLLLEKVAPKESDTIGGLMSSLNSLGSTFGIVKVDDYLLINLNDGKIVPLDVSIEGKNVARHSNCTRQNIAVQKCEDVHFEEALYDKLGLPNSFHYYWAINWIQTSSGPLAIYKTSTRVKVVDINNDKVHTVFQRTLGVNGFKVIEKQDGKVAVYAKLGFGDDTVQDIEAYIAANSDPDLIEPIQTLGD